MTDQITLARTPVALEHAQLKRLELLSLLEATTLVLLVCVAVPLKHLYSQPLGSRVMGPVHGVAFVAYSWTALQTVAGGGWRRREIARLFIVALVPFAGYLNVMWLRRKIEALKGGQAS
jgi:integral membrane protein